MSDLLVELRRQPVVLGVRFYLTVMYGFVPRTLISLSAGTSSKNSRAHLASNPISGCLLVPWIAQTHGVRRWRTGVTWQPAGSADGNHDKDDVVVFPSISAGETPALLMLLVVGGRFAADISKSIQLRVFALARMISDVLIPYVET